MGCLPLFFFNHQRSNKSLYSNGEYTQEFSQLLIFTNDYEDVNPNKTGYVCPATRGDHELPIRAKFLKKDASVPIAHRLCKTDARYGKWDGEKFPKITTRYSKIKCRMCKFKICTFCFCNWGKPLCVQCHGKHLACLNLDCEWATYLQFWQCLGQFQAVLQGMQFDFSCNRNLSVKL